MPRGSKHRIRRGAPWRECIVEDDNGCLVWQGYFDRDGYGHRGGGNSEHPAGGRIHRQVYWDEVGPIPDGLTVDHICRNTACVNPDHLRLLPNEANARDNGNARKTHCPQGHPYDDANTYVRRWGQGRVSRHCRACMCEAQRLYRQRKAIR